MAMRGRKAARRAGSRVASNRRHKACELVSLPEGQDPDSVIGNGGTAAFDSALSEALPLSEFFIRTLTGTAQRPASAEDRAALLGAAKPLLLSMPPGAMRLQLLRELGEVARTPLDAVEGYTDCARRCRDGWRRSSVIRRGWRWAT